MSEVRWVGHSVGLAGDDEADAFGGGLFEHLVGVDVVELLAEREGSVALTGASLRSMDGQHTRLGATGPGHG
ncbi:hypothetical protein CCO04_27885 [Pimelobacter sp. 30-1]|nr:hypothetical protein [Pimelobacter sp. 30-1]